MMGGGKRAQFSPQSGRESQKDPLDYEDWINIFSLLNFPSCESDHATH
jgi:hypothetical protein